MHPRAKLPIINLPKVWVCGSPYVDRNEKLVSAIMKNQKNGKTSNSKFGSAPYGENAKLVSAIMKNQKNGCNAPKMHPRAKLPITDPLKFGSAVLRMLTEMQNWCRPL